MRHPEDVTTEHIYISYENRTLYQSVSSVRYSCDSNCLIASHTVPFTVMPINWELPFAFTRILNALVFTLYFLSSKTLPNLGSYRNQSRPSCHSHKRVYRDMGWTCRMLVPYVGRCEFSVYRFDLRRILNKKPPISNKAGCLHLAYMHHCKSYFCAGPLVDQHIEPI